MKQFARFLLEEGTPDLVGTCVNVDDELPVGLWQGKYRWAQQCVAKVFERGDGHIRRRCRSCGISALVRAFRGFARLAKSLTKRR